MKTKLLSLMLVIVLVCVMLTGCNMRLLDTHYQFNYAYVVLPSGELQELQITRWIEDDNSITIETIDDQVISVSYHNCWLTKNKLEF